jgi:S-adenosylmethionine:tRNA ribosyltransferase-isomerase
VRDNPLADEPSRAARAGRPSRSPEMSLSNPATPSAPSDPSDPSALSSLSADDFDFELPAELIAQHPAPQRRASRLLRVDRSGQLADAQFQDIAQFLDPGDLLVLNDTRVIRARLLGRRASGGRVEVLIERILDAQTALAHVRASHAPRAGSRLALGQGLDVEVLGREADLFRLRLDGARGWLEALETDGQLPLPPYIHHTPEAADEERYQTVYARHPGAVAAPTAGLHFDAGLLEQIEARGISIAWVTLHVGAGTFQPMRSAQIAEHRMHSERYIVPAPTAAAIAATRARGRRITAVGTTCVRALEAAAAQSAPGAAVSGETALFITPGYRFLSVDRLITNFHLPRSTLLMLVSAFAGMETIRRAYRHAVEARYRFFSYGDAMLLERADDAEGLR